MTENIPGIVATKYSGKYHESIEIYKRLQVEIVSMRLII